MPGQAARSRRATTPRRRLRWRPLLEGLEDRFLLYSATGDHFTYGSRITWSIMPDGTNIGGNPSNFVATMDQQVGAGKWEQAIADAFAEWEDVANVNFVQVSDDGSPFGSGNIQQDSPEYGDVRIGGIIQGASVLAFAILPPPSNGGSDSGDILVNTGQAWKPGSGFDLETVIVHEIGHSLGMGHTTDPNAVMYPYYGGVDDTPDSDDIAGIRSIWGPRQEDPVEQATGNTTIAQAANLTYYINPSNDQVSVGGLDVVSPSEAYWFKVTVPAGAGPVLTAQVQSTNLSELSPRVVIFNSAGIGLTQAIASPQAYGATVSASISGITSGSTYYIKVLASNSGDTGAGGYALTLNLGNGPTAIAPPPNTLVAAQSDQGSGYDTISVGGVGGWLKAWVLSGETIGLASLGLPPDPALEAKVNTVDAELANAGAAYRAAFDQTLVGLLQAIPDSVLDSPLFSGADDNDPVKVGIIETMLSGFFDGLQAALNRH